MTELRSLSGIIWSSDKKLEAEKVELTRENYNLDKERLAAEKERICAENERFLKLFETNGRCLEM